MVSEPRIVMGVHGVVHPPTWRGEPFALHFALLREEPSGADLLTVYRWAREQGWPNPRAISPQTLAWSSLFQPRFFAAVRQGHGGIRLASGGGSPNLLADLKARSSFWLQSVIFLAAVTLSAAIVQGRWSSGTLGSKFDRLWMAGEMARLGVALELADLQLCEQVSALAAASDMPHLERLLVVRQLFEKVVERLAADIPARRVLMRCLPSGDHQLARFGFAHELNARVPGLRAVIVYGSSVSSVDFADYDAVLVVDDPVKALRSLHNAHLHWQGKELNVGVYSPEELWHMQLLSGDNLAGYGICVFGEADLPEKPIELLLARNLSFGIVRQRQQLGMIGHALDRQPDDGDDRRNLYHYFVKIPSNVAKGTYGAVGSRRSKEEIQRWLLSRCGFDTVGEQARSAANDPATALANSAVATGAALRYLNEELHIVEPA